MQNSGSPTNSLPVPEGVGKSGIDRITIESNGFGYEAYEEFCDDEEDDDYLDCGMDRHGNCGAAGSEYCEFECPYNE